MEQDEGENQEVLTALHPGHAADIRLLLTAFHQRNTSDFPVFRDIWKQMHFSMVHQGWKASCSDDKDYVQSLYSTALAHNAGFFQLNQPLLLRVGVLYTLYMLYDTQPITGKFKIKISLALWQQLLSLYEEIKGQKLKDPYAVFRKMRKEGYFCLTAVLRSTPSSSSELGRSQTVMDDLTLDTLNADTLTGVINLPRLSDFSDAYASLKEQAISQISEGAPASSLNVISNTFVSELKDVFVQHERQKYLKVVQAQEENLKKPPPPPKKKKKPSRKEASNSPATPRLPLRTSLGSISISSPPPTSIDHPLEHMPELLTSPPPFRASSPPLPLPPPPKRSESVQLPNDLPGSPLPFPHYPSISEPDYLPLPVEKSTSIPNGNGLELTIEPPVSSPSAPPPPSSSKKKARSRKPSKRMSSGTADALPSLTEKEATEQS